MKVVGFNFTKVNLEKKSNNLKNMKITTGIDISNIKEVKSSLLNSPDELIVVEFEYMINYEKDIASFKFNGNMLISIDPKQAKEAISQWKDKKIPEELRLTLFNIILKKSSLKALQFEEEFNLPPHIPLPSFKPQDKKK
jgi:hypothetical protein